MFHYHIAIIDNNKLPYGFKCSNTVTIQLRLNKDYLAPYAWMYMGVFITSKQHQRRYKQAALIILNRDFKKTFTKIYID